MKKLSKLRLIANLLVVVIVVTSFGVVSAQEEPFKDVVNYYPINSWAKETAEKYDLVFLENNTRECKRYEIAKILYYILDLKPSKNDVEFTDLSDLDSETKAIINSVAEAKIIAGYGNGEFKPNNNVTRAEFVSMIDRAGILKTKDKKEDINFSDIQNHWAKQSIMSVTNTGIINGKGVDIFCPDDSITPQEIFVILDRIVNIKCITEDNLIYAMQNTFKCKQYTKQEQYIVEVIYNNYDEVLNFMEYAFPYKKEYDYKNGNEMLNYEDFHMMTSYLMSLNADFNPSSYYYSYAKEMYDNMGWTISTEKKSDKDYYTMYDMLHIILDLEVTAQLDLIGMGTGYFKNVNVHYSNKNTFTDEQVNLLNRYIGTPKNTLLVDNDMYFPFDAPVTKYMFNYFIMHMCQNYDAYPIDELVTEVTGESNEYELDPNKQPYNYYEYPYIIKGIPLELYEKPYFDERFPIKCNPAECYFQYKKTMKQIIKDSYQYYNTILNVDYRTINLDTFKSNLNEVMDGIPDGDIEAYVNYVKENEIILEGKGIIVPGTATIVEMFLHAKAYVSFKIVSAKKMENLLFGDMSFQLNQPVEYLQTDYELYPSVYIPGVVGFFNGKLHTFYTLKYQTVLEGIKIGYGDYKLP